MKIYQALLNQIGEIIATCILNIRSANTELCGTEQTKWTKNDVLLTNTLFWKTCQKDVTGTTEVRQHRPDAQLEAREVCDHQYQRQLISRANTDQRLDMSAASSNHRRLPSFANQPLSINWPYHASVAACLVSCLRFCMSNSLQFTAWVFA